jgi:hypothetical protein
MKLSEAILLGSVGSEQGFGPGSLMGVAKCAIGAAFHALGITLPGILNIDNKYTILPNLYPWTKNIIEYSYSNPYRPWATIELMNIEIYGIIWRLNDINGWTRPQIAAWVAELELIYDPQPSIEIAYETVKK